ncbi:MAG: hypothetical protein BWY68_00638 [bacterium ADurb.Bin400]|nr:MAG: hypothetical protein BWY68_00679 [bacterium ADurb.Bin400]OQA03791.1 MAG: hypothetical protein BWY68_00638 [bacterium ADurb.Bin400]
MHKEIARVGSDTVDHNNLKAYEAVAMSVVAVLAITVGTIYGTMLF